MKKVLLAAACVAFFAGCSLFRKSEKYGCPTNGKNVGAEKILSGDQKSLKAVKKAKKFNS